MKQLLKVWEGDSNLFFVTEMHHHRKRQIVPEKNASMVVIDTWNKHVTLLHLGRFFADDTPLTNSQPAMMGMKTVNLLGHSNSIVGLRMAESTLHPENQPLEPGILRTW